MEKLSHFFSGIIFLFSSFFSPMSHTENVPISLFPMQHYQQKVDVWLKPNADNYDQLLISKSDQKKRLQLFYNHLFGKQSPWNPQYVDQLLNQSPDLETIENEMIQKFDNAGKAANDIQYGENFRPHTQLWIKKMFEKMNIDQFKSPLIYHRSQRGIVIMNTQARALPSNDVSFNQFTQAGQGYPFDNLQVSSVWVGTPIYIIGQTKDKAWSLVLTPDFIAWLKTNVIAHVNYAFVHRWKRASKRKLMAITKTKTRIIDVNGIYRFTAYVGFVFPAAHNGKKIFIPILMPDGNAAIGVAHVGLKNAVSMPLSATPHHFAMIIKTMINRPYGWGGMYFYNDCSQELKSLYTPFAIWLPRHSSYQINAGKIVDESAKNRDQRIAYLMKEGHPLMTIIYIGGHIMLYLGNYPNPNAPNRAPMALTYQNIWGLAPPDHSARAVIGGSVLFPLLASYPENPHLNSLANANYFKVSFLDTIPSALLTSKVPTLKQYANP